MGESGKAAFAWRHTRAVTQKLLNSFSPFLYRAFLCILLMQVDVQRLKERKKNFHKPELKRNTGKTTTYKIQVGFTVLSCRTHVHNLAKKKCILNPFPEDQFQVHLHSKYSCVESFLVECTFLKTTSIENETTKGKCCLTRKSWHTAISNVQ